VVSQVAGGASQVESSEHGWSRYPACSTALAGFAVTSGQTRGVISSAAPQLSALATSIADLTQRVTALAHELDHEDTQQVAADLFEVERLLRNATRRIDRARRGA
jgi:hypothetical protein